MGVQGCVSALSTDVAGLALCLAIAQQPPRDGPSKGQTDTMKIQTRTEPQHRRLTAPEMGLAWSAEESVDKGRKHEAFDTSFYSGERRGLARAMRLDRKR